MTKQNTHICYLMLVKKSQFFVNLVNTFAALFATELKSCIYFTPLSAQP